MPADETPRQKKQASYSCGSTPATLKSYMSLRTSSCSLGCVRSVELRPTASTLSTPSSRRHSRRTPCPTIPVAPKRITFMTAPLHSTQRLWLPTFLLLLCSAAAPEVFRAAPASTPGCCRRSKPCRRRTHNEIPKMYGKVDPAEEL